MNQPKKRSAVETQHQVHRMKNAVNLYITPSGRQVVVPDEVWRSAKLTKAWEPDRRHAGNALYVAWTKVQDEAVFAPDWVDAALEELQ